MPTTRSHGLCHRNRIIAATADVVTPDSETLRLGTPTPLLDMRVPGPTGVIEQYAGSNNVGAGYDIVPDGQRFVMVRVPDPQRTREILSAIGAGGV